MPTQLPLIPQAGGDGVGDATVGSARGGRPCADRVRALECGPGVPIDRIRGGGVRADGGAVDEELHTLDPARIRRGGAQGDDTVDVAAAGRGEAHLGEGAAGLVRRSLGGTERVDERLGDSVRVATPLGGGSAATRGTVPVRQLAGLPQDGQGLGGRERGVDCLHQGGNARHVWRRHAGAVLGLVATTGVRGIHVDARGGHVNRWPVVAEDRERVIALVRKQGQDELASGEAPWIPIEVGDRGDADDLREGGRHERPRVGRVVSGPTDEHDPEGVSRADRRMERVIDARAPLPRVAPTHVGDIDVVGRARVGIEGDDPVHAAQDERLGAIAGVVEHFDRHQGRLGRDADDADVVEWRCGCTGDVRAVAVAVVRRDFIVEAIEARIGVDAFREVWVIQIDPGVDDGNPCAGPAVTRAVGVATADDERVDAFDAEWVGLSDVHGVVWGHGEHIRVLPEGRGGLG